MKRFGALAGTAWVLALAGFAIVACSWVVDLEPLSNGCGEDGRCRPAVPPGWEGPALLTDGPIDGGCTPPFANATQGTLFVDPEAGATGCRCECTLAPGSCSWGVAIYPNLGCTGSPFATFPFQNGCYPAQASGAGVFAAKFEAGVVSADAGCVGRGTVTGPPPPLKTVHLCLGAFLHSSCAADDLCIPRGAVPCVARAGDQTCPPSYPKKRVLPRKVDDGRGCSACSCALDASVCAPPPNVLVSTTSCGQVDGGTLVVPAGSCASSNVTIEAGNALTITPAANGCTVQTESTPSGAIVPSDVLTVCCTE